MQLFDTTIRAGLGGRFYAEPMYHYLNRTGRAPFVRIRQLLETWAAQFPELIMSEWLGRFQSDDNRHHVGAFLELFCRALLAGQGYTVEREPPAEGERQTKPEFLVLRDGQAKFLLECTVAAGFEFGGAHQKRINRVYDALDRVHSPDFFVGVQVSQATEMDPPGRSIRHFVEQHLRGLNVQEVVELAETKGHEALPRWRWAQRGWEVVLFPIPKKPEFHGMPEVRPLGIIMSDIWRLNTPEPIFSALRDKASRYGRPRIPYVIAVNAMDFFADEHSIAAALFGNVTWVWNTATPDVTEARLPDGFWQGPQGPQHKRVSAVLFARSIVPHSVAAETPVLWHNPWADFPLDPALWQAPQMMPDVAIQRSTLQEGKSGAELLGLDPAWPGWDDDRDEDS